MPQFGKPLSPEDWEARLTRVGWTRSTDKNMTTLYDQLWGISLDRQDIRLPSEWMKDPHAASTSVVKADFIDLGIPDLIPSTNGRLIVRTEYDLVYIEVAKIWEDGQASNIFRGAVVVGQPGIGMPIYVWYLLAIRLGQKQHTIVSIGHQALFFHERGIFVMDFSRLSDSGFKDMNGLVDEGTWVLLLSAKDDNDPPPIFLVTPFLSPFFPVQLAPDNPSLYLEWSDRRSAEVIVMNPCTQEEIIVAGLLQTSLPTSPSMPPWFPRLLKAYRTFGPSPGTCFRAAETETKFAKEVTAVIAAVQGLSMRVLLETIRGLYPPPCSIILLRRSRLRAWKRTYMIISPFAACQLALSLQSDDLWRFAELHKALSTDRESIFLWPEGDPQDQADNYVLLQNERLNKGLDDSAYEASARWLFHGYCRRILMYPSTNAHFTLSRLVLNKQNSLSSRRTASCSDDVTMAIRGATKQIFIYQSQDMVEADHISAPGAHSLSSPSSPADQTTSIFRMHSGSQPTVDALELADLQDTVETKRPAYVFVIPIDQELSISIPRRYKNKFRWYCLIVHLPAVTYR